MLCRDQVPSRIHLPPNIPEQHTSHLPVLLVVDHSFTMRLFPIGKSGQSGIQLTNRFVTQFEKIGIEKRQVLILLSTSSHVSACLPPHRVSVVFMFYAEMPIQGGIVKKRHVSGGVNVRLARAQELVHHNPVASLEPGHPGQFDIRLDANSSDYAVNNHLSSALSFQDKLLAPPLHPNGRLPAPYLHTLLAVKVVQEL